ncbi:MAG: DNA polymerase III subunit delta, partial [Oscillospiraceae bacterium]
SIKKKVVEKGFEDFNFFRFEGKKVGVEEIAEAIEQFPQMSEKKMIFVKNTGLFQNATTKDFKRIKEIVGNLPPYVCVIFEEDNFDKKKIKNLKFIEEVGGVINFEYLPINKLEVWLGQRFDKAEKYITAPDLSHMIRLCGQSLGKIDMEFEKLINYLGDRKKITREDIDAVVDLTVEYRVYDMLDNIVANKSKAAREQLQYLRNSKEKPNTILSIMMGKMSELLLCKLLKEDGMQAGDMTAYFDYFKPSFVVKKTIDESKYFGEKFLKRMIDKGLKYDIDIKTGKLEGWTAVEMYLAELTIK